MSIMFNSSILNDGHLIVQLLMDSEKYDEIFGDVISEKLADTLVRIEKTRIFFLSVGEYLVLTTKVVLSNPCRYEYPVLLDILPRQTDNYLSLHRLNQTTGVIEDDIFRS